MKAGVTGVVGETELIAYIYCWTLCNTHTGQWVIHCTRSDEFANVTLLNKKTQFVFAHNVDKCQPIFIIFGRHRKLQKGCL